jgi:circadian clock protein KaiC
MESAGREFGVKRRRLEIRKLRASRYREGFHDYAIETGGVVVYPRLVASEHVPGHQIKPLSSGTPQLDELLGGGLDSGTSTLLMGPAGCSKSTIAARINAPLLSRLAMQFRPMLPPRADGAVGCVYFFAVFENSEQR